MERGLKRNDREQKENIDFSWREWAQAITCGPHRIVHIRNKNKIENEIYFPFFVIDQRKTFVLKLVASRGRHDERRGDGGVDQEVDGGRRAACRGRAEQGARLA